MKYIFSLLSLSPFLVSAQIKKYDTHIDSAGIVNINKGNVTINKAGTVPPIRSKLFVFSASDTIDSAGIHVTSIKIGHKENSPLNYVHVQFTFSDSVLSVDDSQGNQGNGWNMQIGLSHDHKQYDYMAERIDWDWVRNANGVILYSQ